MTKIDDVSELAHRIADENKENATLYGALLYLAHRIDRYIPCNCNEINKPGMVMPYGETK